MDLFDHNRHIMNSLQLSYNKIEGHVNLGETAIKEKEWQAYKDIYFEHSDTCPSRRNRLVSENHHEPTKLSEKLI